MHKKRRLEGLQFLRAIAASLVVLDHTIMNLYDRNINGFFEFVHKLPTGNFGVMVFFVISGFIMVYTSYKGGAPAVRPLNFAWHRFRRIVPIYWLATLSYAILDRVKLGHWPSFSDIWRSMLFVPLSNQIAAYVPGDTGMTRLVYPILGQGWTLYLEIAFYIIFTFCLLADRYDGIIIGAISLIILSLAHVVSIFNFDNYIYSSAYLFYTLPIISLFAIGMLLGKLIVAEDIIIKDFDYALLVSVVIMAIAICINNTIVSGVAAILSVYLLINFKNVEGRSGWRLVGLIGDASYSIYLFHNFSIGLFGRLWFHLFENYSQYLFVLSCVTVSIVFGIFVHIGVERPLIQFLLVRKNAARSQVAA